MNVLTLILSEYIDLGYPCCGPEGTMGEVIIGRPLIRIGMSDRSINFVLFCIFDLLAAHNDKNIDNQSSFGNAPSIYIYICYSGSRFE